MADLRFNYGLILFYYFILVTVTKAALLGGFNLLNLHHTRGQLPRCCGLSFCFCFSTRGQLPRCSFCFCFNLLNYKHGSGNDYDPSPCLFYSRSDTRGIRSLDIALHPINGDQHYLPSCGSRQNRREYDVSSTSSHENRKQRAHSCAL